jgi:uncharacterized membrane protein YphA (DoxX/SURF4 family)
MTISPKPERSADAALLLLRLGSGICFVLLLTLKQADAGKVFILFPGRLAPQLALSFGTFLVTIGLLTRFAAGFGGLCWAWAMYGAISAGEEWAVIPVRAVLFIFIFVTLAIAGPGKYSGDGWINSKVAVK